MSNTGWMSVGELAITRRMSLVAVCCLERLLRLSEQADVLDGDDGLIGERLEKADLPVGKETTSVRRRLIVPIATPSRIKGTLRFVR